MVLDHGWKFFNKGFEKLARDSGFIHVLFPPETPKHNAYAKQENRTILDKARCLLQGSNFYKKYWTKAINTAVFLSNLSPTVSRKQITVLCVDKKARGIKNFQNFGCKAYILVPKHKQSWKLGPTGDEGILLG